MLPFLRDCARVDDQTVSISERRSEVELLFTPSGTMDGNTKIFDLHCPRGALIDSRTVEYCIQNMRRQVFLLENKSDSLRVEEINKCFSLLCETVNVDSNALRQHLKQFRVLLRPVIHYPKEVFFVACSDRKSEFFHAYIDWRWKYLTLLLKIELVKASTDMKLLLTHSQFETEFKMLLVDLTCISVIRFENSTQPTVGCDCVQKIWKNLAVLAEKLRDLHYFESFEVYLKFVLDVFQQKRLESALKGMWLHLPVGTYFTRLPIPSQIEVSQPSFFNIWLLCGLSSSFDGSTFEVLHNSFEEYLRQEPNEDKLRQVLLLMAKSFKSWEPNCELISLAWGCLYKRINSAFSIQNSTLDALIVSRDHDADYIAEIQEKLKQETTMKDNSFTIFLKIISNLDQKSNHSMKIVSRIFSKLNASKIVTLSERGLHNFVELMVTLGISTELADTGNRLMDIMLQLQFNKLLPERQKIIARGHLSLVQLLFNKGADLTKYLERLIGQLKETTGEAQVNLMKLLAQLCQRLLSPSYETSIVLLGPWITTYLYSASNMEKETMFSLFMRLLEGVLADSSSYQILRPMFDHGLTSVKQHFLKNTEVRGVSRLAALFCMCARGTDGLPSFLQLFNFFGAVNRSNIKNSLEFYTTLLEFNFAPRLPAALAVQQWIRFYLFLDAEQLQRFNELVVRVPEIGEIFPHTEVRPSPLVLFSLLNRAFHDASDIHTRGEKSTRAERYLSNFEQYATGNHPPEITFRIYQFLTNLLFKCGPMLYSRTKPSCFLNVAFQHFILTPTVMIGKVVPSSMTQGVLKSFPFLFELLIGMQFRQDPGLTEKLDGLVLKWTPILVKINQSAVFGAYLKIIGRVDGDGIEYIATKVSTFLAPSGRMVGLDAQWTAQLLKILVVGIREETKVQSIVRGCIGAVLEHSIMVDDFATSKKTLLEMFRELEKCFSTYDLISNSLKTTTKSKLIHYEKQFFSFLRALATVSPNLLRKFLPFLQEAIIDVENLLGVTKDSALRSSLDSLHRSLSNK